MTSISGYSNPDTIFDDRDTTSSAHACIGMMSLPVLGYNDWDTNDWDTMAFAQTCMPLQNGLQSYSGVTCINFKGSC